MFPGLGAATAPINGGCVTPIGRSRHRRPQPTAHPYRPPSPTLMMLAGLRRQVAEGFVDIAVRQARMETDISRIATTTGEHAENVDHLRVRITALERHAGARPKPKSPKHTRRRPLE